MKEIYRSAKTELEVVEERLLELSPSENKSISETVSAILRVRGKRLRPALLLMAAKACDYVGERGIKLAVAIELIHTASLVHDDLIDNSDLRRGVRTINSRWGKRISVLVGDHLYSKVVAILAEVGDLEVMRSVADTTGKMTDGEMAEILCQHDMTMTEEKYLSIIAGKTASLMCCSCRIGAMLGDVSNGKVNRLGEYGLGLGMAFQITDDLLDLSGEKERLGKPPGSDIREGRLTLPFIRTMSVAAEKDREWMADVFKSGQINEGVLTRMRNMAAEYGGIEYSLEKARGYSRACKEHLQSLGKSESRTSLAMLADYVVERAS